MRVIDVVGDEAAWKDTVVRICVGGAGREQMKLRRGALDADATLEQELAALRGEAVLVCERRFEVELMVRPASEPVAQCGQRACRVEVAVEKAVGFRLIARAIVGVSRERVVLAELVAHAASQRVRERDLRTESCLFQIREGTLVVIHAKDGVAPRAVVPQKTVAAE